MNKKLDKNGKISKKIHFNNPKEILFLENEAEIFENKIKKLDKDLHNQEGVLYVSKRMLISLPIVIFLTTSISFIYGGLTYPSEFLSGAIYSGIKGLINGSAISGVAAIYFDITRRIYNKKAEKTRMELFISTRLRQSYEKNLSDIKEKQLIIKSPTISINEPVSFMEQTNTTGNQINEKINKNYTDTEIEKSPKKLELRRKINKNIQ